MKAILHLQLLGGFALTVSGRSIALGGGRLHALLAYLVLHPAAPQSRQQIASRFWPDVLEAQGRNNLRQLVHQLRQAWPEHEEWIDSDSRALQWRNAPGAYVDAIELERGLASARAMRGGSARSLLGRVVRSYAGELLPDCYDEWIAPHRDRLHQTALAALDLIVRLAEEELDYSAAVGHAERLLALEPLDERTYLRLIRLHALAGDQTSALRVYAASVATLQRELGVAPGPELRDAHKRLARPRSTVVRRDETGASAPLIGRAPEWQQLLQAWHHVKPGRATLALVTGEAGLGKTRLGLEMLQWADVQGIAVARTRAYAAEGRQAFSPISGWLRSEPVRESLSRLDPLWRTEVARLSPEILVEQPDLARPAPLAEYWQRQQFFEALARAVTGAAPALVLLMDDLQWCDGETLEWLHYLMRFNTDARLLVIGTVRGDEVDVHHPLGRLTAALRRTDQLVELALAPLDAAETAKLASGITGAELEFGAAFRLFSQTEGNPLFVVETLRAGLPLQDQLPPKVHAVITDRLHQLSADAREVAGLAATIGRAFSIDILTAASDLGDVQVARALEELWQRRIVRDGGSDVANESLDFTHDRLREVAATELSPIQRQRHHRRIAEALERARADDLDAVSAQIASHYDQAREAVRAFPYYERAARIAARVFAYDEVQALMRRALALVDRHPEAARAALELPLQVSMASAIRVSQGWASPALEDVQARVVELSRSVGDAEQRAAALLTMIFFSEVRGELHHAKQMMIEVPAAMRDVDSPALRVMAYNVEVGVNVFVGRFAKAEAVYVVAKEAYDPVQHRKLVELTGVDFGVLSCAQASHGLWCLGEAEAAFERGHQAVALARSLAHPFSKAMALTYLATIHQMNGDLDHTRTFATEAHTISERHRVLYYVAWSAILLAWADACREPSDEAVALVEQRIEELVATGGRTRLPYYRSLVAGLRVTRGELVIALSILDEAIAISHAHGDAWWDAELHRRRGDVLQRLGDERALAAFETALAIATEQSAGMFERRIRDSLTHRLTRS